MNILNTLLGTPLGYIMWLCYTVIQNYGLAIVVFTFLTKVILFPLNIWIQKNSIKMIKIQPQLNEIAAKYVGQRDTIAEKQLAYYKKENYKPLASVIPMFIQILLVLGLIGVIYNPLQHLLRIDQSVIDAFSNKAVEILQVPELGSSAQLKVIELIHDPAYTEIFSSLQVNGQDVPAIVSQIQAFNTNFLGINLSHVPSIGTWNILLLIPFLSGLSAFLLSFCQNKVNVLQQEQGWLGRWGMAIFLTLFSTYFAFLVPTGVGLYWICGNLFAILVLFVVNWIYKPKNYIDYEALEKSKQALAESKAIEKQIKPTKEQKLKAKADYKRFFQIDNIKQLVFYSEKSGFYKYYRSVIAYLIENSDVKIHYVTSDPNDAVFDMKEAQIIPYYIDDNRLIPLFMKMDADVVVMTTPDLQNYHLKRSLVRKDVEYIYMFHGLASTHMTVRKGAYDHFNTLFCVGQHQIDEIRESEKIYGLKPKKLIPCGYGMFDDLLKELEENEGHVNEVPQILIAPSHQEDNLMDTCIEEILSRLVKDEYKVILRPHPQYLKRNPGKIEKFILNHKDMLSDKFIVETDFSSNDSIFLSDLLITDWSGIAYEFSYATKRPSLFINTPMKVLNPDYEKYSMEPLDITLRSLIGISVDPENIDTIAEKVKELLDQRESYKVKILDILDKYVFNVGHSGEIGGKYIIECIQKGTDDSI